MKKAWLACLLFWLAFVPGSARADFWQTLRIPLRIAPTTKIPLQIQKVDPGLLQIIDTIWGPTRRYPVPYDHRLLRGSYSLYAKYPNELFLDVKMDIWHQKTYIVISALNSVLALELPQWEGDIALLRDLGAAANSVFCSDLAAAPGGLLVGCTHKSIGDSDPDRRRQLFFHYQTRAGVWSSVFDYSFRGSGTGSGEWDDTDKIKVALCDGQRGVIAWETSSGVYGGSFTASDRGSGLLYQLGDSESGAHLLNVAANLHCDKVFALRAPGREGYENLVIHSYIGDTEAYLTNWSLRGDREPYGEISFFQNPRNINERHIFYSYFNLNDWSFTIPRATTGILMSPNLSTRSSYIPASIGGTEREGTGLSLESDSNLRGDIYLAWSAQREECVKSYLSHFDPDPDPARPGFLYVDRDGEATEEIGTECGNEHPVVAAGSNGHVLVAWQKSNPDGSYSVFAKYFNPDSETWSSPKKLSEAGDARYPRVTLDPVGQGTVAWVNVTPGSLDAAVEARSLRIP
jgi:hypothetical protein